MKQKTCKVCNTHFVPFNTTDKVCGVPCAIKYVKKQSKEKELKAWRKEKLEKEGTKD